MASNRFLLIDSRDRTADSVSSTQFRVILPEAIHNVREVKLRYGDPPRTMHLRVCCDGLQSSRDPPL